MSAVAIWAGRRSSFCYLATFSGQFFSLLSVSTDAACGEKDCFLSLLAFKAWAQSQRSLTVFVGAVILHETGKAVSPRRRQT